MSTSRATAEISQEEAGALFAILAPFATLIVAVSGGPDSLAMLHLLAEWARRLQPPQPRLCAVTIDHGLRAASGAEARLVAGAAAALNIPHETLVWTDEKPVRGLPDAARRARYTLLERFAAEFAGEGPKAVVTAHHRDDQAETVFMRLLRGSGIDGLAGMQPVRPISQGSAILLVRPLLAIPKARLVASLRGHGENWIEDPTNARTDLERGRVRALLARLAPEGLSAAAVARSAARLSRARDAVQYADERFRETLGLELNNGFYARFFRPAFEAGPPLLRERLLACLMGQFGGSSPAPDLAEVEALAQRLRAAEGRPFKATLGGAVIAAGKNQIRIWREPGRIDPAPRPLGSGQSLVWDARFKVSAARSAPDGLDVAPLGDRAYRALSAALGRFSLPAEVSQGLPAFRLQQRVIAVPGLVPFAPPGGHSHTELGQGLALKAEPLLTKMATP